MSPARLARPGSAAWVAAAAALFIVSFPNALAPRFPTAPASLAFLALAPLLLAIDGRGPFSAFRRGWLAGFLGFAGTLYWISYVRPMGPAAPVSMLALSAYLALFFGAFAALAAWGLDRLPLPLLWLPAAWTLLEALRGWLFTGFPWAGLGHSQYRTSLLLPVAAAAGVHALHFACAAGGTLVFLALTGRRRLLAGQALLIVVGLFALWRLGRPACDPIGPPVRVAVVQGNIDQDQPWTPEYRRALWDAYRARMDEAVARGARVLLWPEATLPGILSRDNHEADALKAYTRDRGVQVLAGAYDLDPATGQPENCVVLFDRGQTRGAYAKRHLVPFGEYTPFRRFLPFLDQAVRRFGAGDDFKAGDGPVLLPTEAGEAAPLICYEGIFPGLAAEAVRGGAQWLAVSTFDTWYGHSAGPYQHASLAVFRAVEQGRWLARAGATGVSMFVSSEGRITQCLDLDAPGVLVEDIQPRIGRTLYSRMGDWFLALCIGFLALAAVLWAVKANGRLTGATGYGKN